MSTGAAVTYSDLTPDERSAAAAVLGDAFKSEPCMRWIFRDQLDHLDASLRGLFAFSCDVRFDLGWPLYGAHLDGRLVGVAGASMPATPDWPETLSASYANLSRLIGAQATSRLEYASGFENRHRPETPTIGVGFIGVDPSAQRRGVGKGLLETLHTLVRRDRAFTGAYLATTDPINLPFYARSGYAVIAEDTIAPGVTIWEMYRPRETDESHAGPA